MCVCVIVKSKAESIRTDQDVARADVQSVRRALAQLVRVVRRAEHVHKPVVRILAHQSSAAHHDGQHEPERARPGSCTRPAGSSEPANGPATDRSVSAATVR